MYGQTYISAMAPRYQQLADLLIDDIAEGRYLPGSLLPTEAQLCEQHDVSRHTVREALRRLDDLGMISRRAGVGTRVESRAPVGDYLSRVGSSDDLMRLARETRLESPETRELRAEPELAAALRCQPGRRWVCVAAPRVARGDPSSPPICWAELYVDPRATPIRERLTHDRFTPAQYAALLDRFTIEQEISAAPLPVRLAHPLRAEAGEPALRVVRRYLDPRRDVVAGEINFHPGGRYAITMTLRRERAHRS